MTQRFREETGSHMACGQKERSLARGCLSAAAPSSFSYRPDFPSGALLSAAAAVEDVFDLVLYHGFDRFARGCEVLARVEVVGVLREVLAD